MKRAILALGMTCALFLGFSGSASASYTCTTVDSMASSPGHAAKECGTSTEGSKIKDTLVDLGQYPNDAAARLTQIAIPPNETLTIQINDPSLLVPIDVEYETKEGDSSVAIAKGLADAVNADPYTSSVVFAYASADVLNIFSLTGLSTFDSTGSAHVTLTDSGTTIYVDADLRTNITWYLYTDHDEYADSFALDGGPSYPSTSPARVTEVGVNGLIGDTLTSNPSELYSVIFKTDSPDGSHTNSLLKYTTTHETGHLLDYLYGQSGLMDSRGSILSGTLTPGDVIGMTFTNSSGPESQTYEIQSGDDFADVTSALASAINSNVSIQAMGVHAIVVPDGSGGYIISLSRPRGVSITSTVSSGATVSWFDDTPARLNYSSTEAFKQAFDIDILALNAKPPCGFHYDTEGWSPEPYEPMAWTSGVFSGILDEDGNPICTGDHEETLSSSYSGTNLHILQQAFVKTARKWDPSALSGPNPMTKEEQRAELFASLYPYWTYHSDAYDDSDTFRYGFHQMVLSFSCTALYVEKLVKEGKNPEGWELDGFNHVVPDNDGLDGFTRYRCNGVVEAGNYGGGS